MDLKMLIYSKGFDHDLTLKLLHIADSKTWLEDLIDLIGEGYVVEEEECDGDCDKVDELIEQKEKIQGNLNKVNLEITIKIAALREKMNLQASTSDGDMDDLSDLIDEYVDFRVKNAKITVGGVDLPERK